MRWLASTLAPLFGRALRESGGIDLKNIVARGLTMEAPNREPDEQIENLIVPRATALAMIHDGTICDAKTIIGFFLGT